MLNKKPIDRLLIVFLILMTSLSAYTQNPDPSTKPRTHKQEQDRVYRDWVEKDVAPIITAEEKKAYLLLTTNEERENFIGWFWNRRDPNPDTEENEFRDEYYERVAYANESFTSGKPGQMTDRGKIYIAWGKPDSIESRPTGGAYDRPAWEGGGTTTVYPFEIWFYRHLEGLGSGIEFEFVDASGSGEYRLSIDASEKDATRTVPGAGGSARDALGLNDREFMREQDSKFRRIELLAGAFRPPPLSRDAFDQSFADTPVIDNNPLGFDVRVDFFSQSEDRVVFAITVLANKTQQAFTHKGGNTTARMNKIGRITSFTPKRPGTFKE
jgi:GWxTD domain-containing protein